MHSTEYLYGIKANELVGMRYVNAIQYKRDKGTRLYRKLFLIPERTFEEDERMFFVAKAVRHSEQLLEEIS